MTLDFWCLLSDSGDEDDDDFFEEDDMFSRLEESRAKLETELGCDTFLKAYKTVQVGSTVYINHIVNYVEVSLCVKLVLL